MTIHTWIRGGGSEVTGNTGGHFWGEGKKSEFSMAVSIYFSPSIFGTPVKT